MGFRDLKLFNVAMVGKQGWRLMTRPESLCARVLKGRYFHDSDFLLATRKKHASLTWRSILASREVLKMGLTRRIGDGSETRIWRDSWLPNHFGGHPITPEDGQENQMVSDLITASGAWNEGLVRDVFFPVDAYAILKIPISVDSEDFWAWSAERHGNYSVKSAYRLLDEEQRRVSATPDATTSREPEWRAIWQLSVPPKVKVFWWRVLHEYLPAKQVLHRRHVEPVANCDPTPKRPLQQKEKKKKSGTSRQRATGQ